MSIRSVNRALLVAALTAASVGCSEDAGITTFKAGTVRIVPENALLSALGDTMTILIQGVGALDLASVAPEVSWQSLSPSVASVSGLASGHGIVTAIGEGTAAIVVSLRGHADTAEIVVRQEIVSVELTRTGSGVLAGNSIVDPQLQAVGDTARLEAIARDRRGKVVRSARFIWASTAPTVVEVDATGLVRAKEPGWGRVRTRIGSLADSVEIGWEQVPAALRVSPSSALLSAIGDELQLNAAVVDRNGFPVDNVSVQWRTLASGIVSVDELGRIRALANGTTQVEGSAGQLRDTTEVQVSQSVSRIVVDPASAQVPLGGTVNIAAYATDSQGQPVAGAPITWSTANPAIARVTAAGTVSGVSVGTTQIIATSGSHSTRADVQVVQTIERVVVAPASATIAPGASVTLAARAEDAAGNHVTGVDLVWTSLDPAIAWVNQSGVVTGLADGPATIRVSAGGYSATAAITVVSATAARIILDPTAATLAPGGTVMITARALTANDNLITGRTITWTSSSSSVASVSPATPGAGYSGGAVVTAQAGGTAIIRALLDGVIAEATITVNQPPPPPAVTSVTVTPSSSSLTPGQTVQLTATPRDAAGNPVAGLSISWNSSNATIASVNSTGLVAAVTAGSPVTITATANGVAGTATITVTTVSVASVSVTPATSSLNVGQTVQLTATPRDAAGNVLAGRAITWTSSNNAVATVNASGLVTGVAAGGPVTITATSEGRTGTAAVTVTQVAVATISLAPSSTTIQLGQTVTLIATLRDGSGNILTGRPVTWTSSNTAIASVSSAGVVTGTGAGGPITITASSGGQSGTATVTVIRVPVRSVTVTPSTTSIQVGQTAQFTAVPRDSAGNALAGRIISWTSSNNAVATVNSTGLVTGQGIGGPVTITATADGVSGTGNVTVTAAVVTQVAVTPTSGTLSPGGTLQLTATPRDAGGNTVPGATVSWSSSNSGVATVSASGLVTAVASGTATITATSGNGSGSSTITVTTSSGGVGNSRGFGPRDFPAGVLVTGEDWQGMTVQQILNMNFFTSDFSTNISNDFALVSNPVFGTVLRVNQTPTNWTIKGGRGFGIVREWAYSAVFRFDPNWGNGNWKAMFGGWAEPNSGTMRVEICSVHAGQYADLCHSGKPANWTSERTLQIDPARRYDLSSGDYYQSVMFVKLKSATDVRIGWAFRKLTTNGGTVFAPGSWIAVMDSHNPGTWNDDDGIRSIALGNTLNNRPTVTQSLFYGPWVVIDLSAAGAPTDPWGLFSYLGM